MRRKNKDHRSKETMVFLLNLPQRTALWIALDLLCFSKDAPDVLAVTPICKKLQHLDGKDQFIELELSVSESKLAIRALDLGVQFLDGLHPYFDETSPAFVRLAAELREHNPVVRNLRHRFHECD